MDLCLKLVPLVILLISSSVCSNTWKLNVPRVLLPLTEEGASFKLFSKGGCFVWKSTRPEVIVVTPIPDLPKDLCMDKGSTLSALQNEEKPKCTSAATVWLLYCLRFSQSNPPDQEVVDIQELARGSNPIGDSVIENVERVADMKGFLYLFGLSVSISGNLHSSLGKTQAVVMAEDFNSPGRVLRTDVIADSIRSLQIVTKTHELFLEEAPEEFSVRAYDDQGNEFSTLEGLIFKWTILDKQHSNIRFIKFRDSSYALDPILEEIESKGQQGDKVLLEGIKTGSAKVSVRLAAKAAYAAAVQPTEVSVLVVANLFLVPPLAYVMSGAVVNYHAEQIKSNKFHRIDLISSSQYFLEVENNNMFEVDIGYAQVKAGEGIGSTRVLLRDKNVELRENLGEVEQKSPSADLHIVEPDHISIEIDPFRSWVVVVGKQYDIFVDIFDIENRKLYMSANVVVSIKFDEEGYFDVSDSVLNGTWLSGKPLKPGNVLIKAFLLGTKTDGNFVPLPVPLVASVTLEIFDEIVIHPQLTVLPWDFSSKSTHFIQYKVLGDIPSSSFIWSSSNTSLTTVTQQGVVSAKAHLIGETTIAASMNRATHNKGTAMIVVAPAIKVKIIDEHVKEAEIGRQLAVPVALYSATSMPFSNCAKFPFTFQLSDERTFTVANNVDRSSTNFETEDACAMVTLSSVGLGFTNAKVSYTYTSPNGDVVHLSDETTIAGFKPLMPVQPESASALLAVGSSYHIIWTGGPQPFLKSPKSHFYNLKIRDSDDEDVISLSKRIEALSGASGGETYVFSVTCQKVGGVDLVLSVGNEKSDILPRPVVSSSRVTVTCGEPHKLKLEAEIPQPKDQTCPLMAKTMSRVPALSYENFPVLVSVYDASGQKFDNFSTFDIAWSVSSSELGNIAEKGVIVSQEIGKEDPPESFIIGNKKSYQIFETKHKAGEVDVTATIKNLGSFLIGGFGSISDTLKINLVDDAIIAPEQTFVFNHPENTATLTIRQGSGFFNVSTHLGSGNIHSVYHSNNQSVRVSPLHTGEAVLQVRDLCLVNKRLTSQARIQVIGVHTVELLIVDKIQLSTSVEAQVRLLDDANRPITPQQLKFITVSLIATHDKVVKVQERSNASPTDLLFDVQGFKLGQTMVTAVVTYNQKQIRSPQMPVQVFPPLSLEPRNITLLIGAKFQIQVVGGPHQQQDSTVEFSINGKVASSNSIGLITANTLGSTKLVGRVYGTDKTTSKRIVISEDSVNVHVVKLEGVKIRAPVHVVATGSELPLHMTGLDVANQNAFSFGTARPTLNFHWTVSNQEVGIVTSVFHRNGINQLNSGIARFLAKRPGRVLIKLRVSITSSIDSTSHQYQLDRDREFHDQIEVKVLEAVQMRSPVLTQSNVVLMSPQSEYQLKTNRDFAAGSKITYSIAKGTSDSAVVTVDKNGLVVAGQTLGVCVVQVAVTEGEFSGVIQHTSVLIEVKPVKFAMLNVLESFSPSIQSKLSNHLPKGVTLGMELSFHDELAAKFDAVSQPNSVEFRPSRFESNQIAQTNETSAIELVKFTETVLRAAHPQGSDFVVFDVRTAISPNLKKITTGDVIVLQSSVASVEGLNRWVSEPPGLFSIKPLQGETGLGLATALRNGQARISYQFNKETRVTLDLETEAASKIIFNKNRHNQNFYLSNFASRRQMVYFNIVSSNFGGDSSTLHNLHLPQGWTNTLTETIPTELFVCQASFLVPRPEFSKLFSINAVFDPVEGSYACKIDPTSSDALAMLFLASEVEIFVRSSSLLSGSNSNILSESITVKFLSTFKLKTEEIAISNLGKHAELIVQGLPEVLDTLVVEVSHPDLFSVVKPRFVSNDDTDNNGPKDYSSVMSIPVSVRSAYWKMSGACTKDFFVEITDKKTSLSTKVPIQVVMDEKCIDINESTSLLFAHYEKIVFTLIVIFVTWIFVAKSSSLKASVSAPPPAAKSVSASAFLNGPALTNQNIPKSPSRLTNSDNGVFTWSTDKSPIYGSPTSPLSSLSAKKSPRQLTQYSY